MSALVDAWQAALAAEQQAAFGYALLGPQLPSGRQQLAHQLQGEHERVRDSTAEAIAAHGATPQPPAGDYPALYPLVKAPQQLAGKLEDDCAAAWRYLLVGASTARNTSALRKQAQLRLTTSALWALRWRRQLPPQRALQPFPGLQL